MKIKSCIHIIPLKSTQVNEQCDMTLQRLCIAKCTTGDSTLTDSPTKQAFCDKSWKELSCQAAAAF